MTHCTHWHLSMECSGSVIFNETPACNSHVSFSFSWKNIPDLPIMVNPAFCYLSYNLTLYFRLAFLPRL